MEILIHLAMAKITSLIFDDTNNNNDDDSMHKWGTSRETLPRQIEDKYHKCRKTLVFYLSGYLIRLLK